MPYPLGYGGSTGKGFLKSIFIVFTGVDRKDLRRRGLEKFLHSVARHPVLACTKILRVFLTDEDSKHDKVCVYTLSQLLLL